MKKQHIALMLASALAGLAQAETEAQAISPIKTLPSELGYYFNWYQPMVGAKTAYTMGARGLGVTVGVVDTGISLSNPEFAGRIKGGYNALTAGKTSANDDNGHGTHVAGIIGAAADGRMTVGIAPDVTLVPIKVLNAAGSGSEASFNAGINYAVQAKTQILNMSLGAPGPFGQAGMQQAVKAGQLVVAAAGNDGGANPNWPARYAKETWANGQVIAVGAVDSAGKIASFSNRAGDTKNFFVVAPGVNIASTYLNNQYVYMSGTSMATPVVSGVAASIWSRWSYLTANQVATIIFKTATDLGTPGVDAVYGWGLVNLDKALQPIGAPKVATYNAAYYALAPSALYTNSVVKAKSFEAIPLTATDDLGRAYTYNMADFAIKTPVSDITTLFNTMDKQMSLSEQVTSRSQLVAAFYGTPTEMQRLGNPFHNPELQGPAATTLAGFNYLQKLACSSERCGAELAFGANGFADKYFGLAANYRQLPLSSNFSSPYFQFASSSTHMGMGYHVGNSTLVKMGVLGSSNFLSSQTAMGYTPTAKGWVAEVSREMGRGLVNFSTGVLREQSTMLGAGGSSAFGMDGAETRFHTLAGAYQLAYKTSLLGQYSVGSSKGGGNSLISGYETRTSSWSVGLAKADVAKEKDQLAFAVSQPMRVNKGQLNLMLPGVDETGSTTFSSAAVNLASDKVETRYEMGYATPAGKNTTLRINAAYRHNADNDVGNTKVLALRWSKAF